MKVPDGVTVKYGNITERNVDDDKHEVTGHVKNYTSGRNQLAFYHEKEEQRQPGKKFLPNANIELSIEPTEELGSILKGLETDIKNFGEINMDEYANKLTNIIMKDEVNRLPQEEILPILQTLVKTTVESEIVQLMRVLELNVFRAKGYKTFNNGVSIDDWRFMDKETLRQHLEKLKDKTYNFKAGTNTEVYKRYVKSGISYLINELG